MGDVTVSRSASQPIIRAHRARLSSRHNAFSLIELFVVIGIIAVLISFLLPTLRNARQQMVTVSCLSQMRQLGMAFEMYATDNKGWMASSDTCGPLSLPTELFVDPTGTKTNIPWTGWVDSGSSSQAIRNGTLWQYVSSEGRTAVYNDRALAVYHCPNDNNPYRLRSYSMSGFIDTGLATSPVVNEFKVYRMNQVMNASKAILFAECPDPRSAAGGETMVAAVTQWNNNGWTQPPQGIPNPNGAWGDLVAAWHNGGSNFTFLDGHAEYWKFKDQRTVDYLKNDPNWPNTVYSTANNYDLRHISEAMVTWPPQRPSK